MTTDRSIPSSNPLHSPLFDPLHSPLSISRILCTVTKLEKTIEPVVRAIFHRNFAFSTQQQAIMSTEVYVTKRRSIQGNTQLVVRDDEGDDEYKQHTTGVTQSKPRGPLMSVGHRDEYKYESQGMYMFRCFIWTKSHETLGLICIIHSDPAVLQ